MLHWCPYDRPTPRDVDLLASLPALGCLRIVDWRLGSEADCTALRAAAHGVMPRLLDVVITLYSSKRYDAEFAAAEAELVES